MEDLAKLYLKTIPHSNIVEEAMGFDPNALEATDGVVISKYCIALSQYLIYLNSQINTTRALLFKKKKFIESTVSILLDEKLVKTKGTKTAATKYLIDTNDKLSRAQDEIFSAEEELIYVEGIDKSITELINSFKRELTRREKEFGIVKTERR